MIQSPAITKPAPKQVDRFRKPAVALSFRQRLQKVLKTKISSVLLQELTCGIRGHPEHLPPTSPGRDFVKIQTMPPLSKSGCKFDQLPQIPGSHPKEALKRGLRQNPQKLGIPRQSPLRKGIREKPNNPGAPRNPKEGNSANPQTPGIPPRTPKDGNSIKSRDPPKNP